MTLKLYYLRYDFIGRYGTKKCTGIYIYTPMLLKDGGMGGMGGMDI